MPNKQWSLFPEQERRKYSEGDQLRDEGIERVLDNEDADFQARARKVLLDMAGMTVIAEDIRFRVIEQIGDAHHPNVWGGLIRNAKKDKILVETGNWRKPTDPKSHSRPVREYIVRRVV